MGRHCVGDAMSGGVESLTCRAVCTSSPLNAYSSHLGVGSFDGTRLLGTLRFMRTIGGCHDGHTSGVRRSGLRHRLRTRQSLIGTRSFGTGHRREPYSSNTASWADVSGHNTLKIGRGKPRRSKGDNPYPTSSKAFGPRDPADVPPRASRGGAGPFLTTAHGATRQPRVDSWSRCPYVPHGPRRLWSRWPVRAARASVSWHA